MTTQHSQDHRYRERIYRYYSSARDSHLAPQTLAGLSPRLPTLNRLIRDHFPANKTASILELGCGYGALIYSAQRQGYVNMKGVDASPEQVAAAQQLGIEGIQQDDLMATLKSLPDESLDAVIAFDVIEHFSRNELIDLVDEVRRVLRIEGCWIIHTPNGASPFSGRMRYWDITHELSFTNMSITNLLLSSGFSEVKCFEDMPAPHGIKSTVRWLLWKVLRGLWWFFNAVETGNASKGQIFSQNFTTITTK